MKLSTTKYIIMNECTGDPDCDEAGILDTFDTFEAASKCLKEEAKAFYEESIDEDDRDRFPLEMTDDNAEFDFYGVTHHYYITEQTISTEFALLTLTSTTDGELETPFSRCFHSVKKAQQAMDEAYTAQLAEITKGMSEEEIAQMFTETTCTDGHARIRYENHEYLWTIQ